MLLPRRSIDVFYSIVCRCLSVNIHTEIYSIFSNCKKLTVKYKVNKPIVFVNKSV